MILYNGRDVCVREREREREKTTRVIQKTRKNCIYYWQEQKWTNILAYKDSYPQLLGLYVKPLTIIITHMMYNHNNYIISYYKLFREFKNIPEYFGTF